MIPFPDKKYSIIYADPPWEYKKSGGTKSSRGLAKNFYSTMSLDEIKNIPIFDICNKNSVLFLWATFPQIKQGLDVLESWGFEYVNTAFVWIKRNEKSGKDSVGMGYWTRANPEICLLGKKGNMKPLRHDIRQIVYAKRGRHSEKPSKVRDLIVELCGDLPRIELFARERVDGWDAWGNEV